LVHEKGHCESLSLALKNVLEVIPEHHTNKYCGIGDFALTSLNDLSRNRTLGLLIGKGFFTDYISEKVVLEGRIAVNVFHRELQNSGIDAGRFPIMNELYKVFNSGYDISDFVSKIII
jgi:glycerol-3-phosphate dehydrogenase (NAD(P)+)